MHEYARLICERCRLNSESFWIYTFFFELSGKIIFLSNKYRYLNS